MTTNKQTIVVSNIVATATLLSTIFVVRIVIENILLMYWNSDTTVQLFCLATQCFFAEIFAIFIQVNPYVHIHQLC